MMPHDPGGKRSLKIAKGVKPDAEIPAGGLYRYKLSRTWDSSLPTVLFVMCNPSIADVGTDDPTIHKCTKLAKRWGYGGLLVGNVFAYRSTDSGQLQQVDDPVGPDNRDAVLAMAKNADRTVLAHGILPPMLKRHAADIEAMLRGAGIDLFVMPFENYVFPYHPRRVAEDVNLLPWNGVEYRVT